MTRMGQATESIVISMDSTGSASNTSSGALHFLQKHSSPLLRMLWGKHRFTKVLQPCFLFLISSFLSCLAGIFRSENRLPITKVLPCSYGAMLNPGYHDYYRQGKQDV